MMPITSLTGDPVYDVGAVGLVMWMIKQGIITIRGRGDSDKEDEHAARMKSISDTLAGVARTMSSMADHQKSQTEMLERNDDRHSNRGKLCAWSAENAPRDVEQIKDLPQKVEGIAQTLHNTREILIATNGKVGQLNERVGQLGISCARKDGPNA